MAFMTERAVLQLCRSGLICWANAPCVIGFRSVQVEAIRTGSHPSSGGWLVSAFFLVVPGRRGVARRARPASRSRHGVALGPAVCPEEMERRLRSRLRATNDSWRVDETYIRVKGKWVYLYRAVDSSGATIDFLLSAKRDAAAAKRFLAKALGGENHPAPRVINTDEHAGYPPAIVRLKAEEALKDNCRHRPVQYLNNVLEQDHRAIKGRIRASQHFRSFWGAWRTIAGYEAIHMIRKGQATEARRRPRAVNSIVSFLVCSARWRSNFADAIAQLRINSKVATLPFRRRPWRCRMVARSYKGMRSQSVVEFCSFQR